jgi:hypothetical protein
MKLPYKEEDVNHLFNIIGQAVWHLQHLEKVLTTFNSLKILQKQRENGKNINETDANSILKKQQRLTLGPLIKAAKKEQTIPKKLIDRFDSFLDERNWVIHKCVINEYLSLRNKDDKNRLFGRIEKFIEDAILLRREVHNLLESWYVETGYDLNFVNFIAEQMIKNAETS